MFDLFRSRDKAVRILLGGLLLVVAISMLTYLVPNYDTGVSGAGAVVASVGSDQITSADVQKMVQAGATRIGASASVKILEQARASSPAEATANMAPSGNY